MAIHTHAKAARAYVRNERSHMGYKASLRRAALALFVLSVCSALLGCKQRTNPLSHGHGHGHSHGGHGGDDHGGHGHGGHDHGSSSSGAAISVTLYTSKVELFMEYAPLVAGKKASFLAHLTWLGTVFQPVRTGSLALDFVRGSQTVTTLHAAKPLRVGIFRPEGKAPSPGAYTLRLRLRTPTRAAVMIVSNAVVYASSASAKRANPSQPDDPKEIPFLKEQQWNIPFATQKVTSRVIHDGVRVTGEVRPWPAGYVQLNAPVTGRITWLKQDLSEGQEVKRGQRLCKIDPMLLSNTSLPQIEHRIHTARSTLQMKRLQLKRLKKMLRARAVASWQIAQVRHQIELQQAQLKAALSLKRLFRRSRNQSSGHSNAIVIHSPEDGVLLKQFASKGTSISQGQPLFTIASNKKVRLTAYLPEWYAMKVGAIRSATYTPLGGHIQRLPKPTGWSASIASPGRTLSVFFDVPRPKALKHFQQLTLHLHLTQRRALAVPAQAVVDEQGVKVVFVLLGGEGFERRVVQTGIHDQHWLEIRSGLQFGERIVTTGAYELSLSQVLKQANAVGHGHAH